METAWFVLVAFMLTAYVILDGFDLGAGIVQGLMAKTEDERRLVIQTIGPVWDGNEVWLLAAGGTLFFVFPALYAASFSGFYLPLMMVLWLLMLRGLGVELRGHIDSSLWRSFCDRVVFIASLLLTIFFGAALGNVLRGVPLTEEGYFFEPLWTTFRVGPHPGILDWYTVLAGLIAMVALIMHGAAYVATKTEGDLNARARWLAVTAWWGAVVLTGMGLAATLFVRPDLLTNYKAYPGGVIFPGLVVASLIGMRFFLAKGHDRGAFVSSSLYIAGMLGGAAFGLYPYLLPASTNPAFGLTIHNAAAGRYGLMVGARWWVFGMLLTLAYFFYLYRSFRGKVRLSGDGHGY